MNFLTAIGTRAKRHFLTALAGWMLIVAGGRLDAADTALGTTVYVGKTVTLTATADGNPAPTFQWLKNGAPISGATNAVLTITAVALSDAGIYQVRATNSAGSALSPEAVLVVESAPIALTNSAPAITTQPAATLAGVSGDTVTFSVVATGTPAPTYQWLKNGQAIAGWTSASLTLAALTSNDPATYNVVVSNVAGSVTSANAQLTVSTPSTPPPSQPSGGGGSSTPPPPSSTAPMFTTAPSSLKANAGENVSFSVGVAGTPQSQLQWRKNGVAISGATGSSLSLSSISTADVAAYSVVATNTAGTVISSEATLSLISPGTDGTTPKFTLQPLSQTVALGASPRISAAANGSPAPTYQWLKNGVVIRGAIAKDLVVYNVTTADTAVYSVIASSPAGAAMSTSAHLVVGGVPGVSAPVISVQPLSQSTVTQSSVSFQIAASGSPAPSLQWRKNGLDIAGATSSVLTISTVNKSDAGIYTMLVRNAYGSVTSNPAQLIVNNPSKGSVAGVEEPGVDSGLAGGATMSRIVNISVRASAGAGDESLIVGFVVSAGAQKPVLIRGIGPTLGAFGVEGALQDPKVSLFSGSVLSSANDDWGVNENAPTIQSTGLKVGAFALGETTNDAALISILRSGAYTAQVSGQGTERGIALIEVYDGASTDAGRLINVSTRARVGTGGDVPHIGFVIQGTLPKKVLIRAVGPTLSVFGVGGVLADPQLELFEGPSRLLHNDDWNGSTELGQAFSRVGAFGFADPLSKDAAILVTLEPGAYTTVVSGVNGATGTVLVEVYEMP